MSREDLLRLLLELRVVFDDADAVTEDLLAPPRRRELGPALHRRNYREAKRKLLDIHAEIVRRLGSADPGAAPAPAH